MKSGALKFGKFTLTSGKVSSYYIDLRLVPSDVGLFRKVIQAYTALINEMLGLDHFDVLAAVPTAGLTFASALAYSIGKPLIYIRSGERTHGAGKMVEGLLRPGHTVLLLDDLITTGTSLLRATKIIRAEGGVVEDAVVLIDRMEGGESALASVNVKVHALAKITELAALLRDLQVIGEEEAQAIDLQVRGQA